MLHIFVAVIAMCAIVGGFAFILSKTVPRMPRNKVYRFIFLFVLCVPFNFAINYLNVWALGYHKMGWTGQFIIASLFAICGTFSPPQMHNSNTP